jgi:hypothetical protein
MLKYIFLYLKTGGEHKLYQKHIFQKWSWSGIELYFEVTVKEIINYEYSGII